MMKEKKQEIIEIEKRDDIPQNKKKEKQKRKALMPIRTNCKLSDDDDNDNKEQEEATSNNSTPFKSKLKKQLKVAADKENQIRNPEETPPIFAFSMGKTNLKKRKLMKELKRTENEEKETKRVAELITFFKTLDEQNLKYV
jgi:hypothetical protein